MAKRRRVVRHCHPLGLLTARQITTLRPEELRGLRRLMTPTFPLRRGLCCPSGLLAGSLSSGLVSHACRIATCRSLVLGFRCDRSTCFAPISVQPAVTDPAGVAAAFRHTRYHSGTGSCTAALGGDLVIPIVARVRVIDLLQRSDNSRLVVSDSPVSDVVSVVSLDMLSATSLCAPLSPQESPVSTEVVDRGVVVSDAVVVPSDVSSVTCRFTTLNPQGSPLSPEVVDRGVMESPVTGFFL